MRLVNVARSSQFAEMRWAPHTKLLHLLVGTELRTLTSDWSGRSAIMQLQAIERKQSFDNQINWVTAFFMAAFHLGAVALFFFSWKALFVAILLWCISGSLGIGTGYHRLLTHRGYRTPKWVEYFLTVCATLTLEGGPIFWGGYPPHSSSIRGSGG